MKEEFSGFKLNDFFFPRQIGILVQERAILLIGNGEQNGSTPCGFFQVRCIWFG